MEMFSNFLGIYVLNDRIGSLTSLFLIAELILQEGQQELVKNIEL